MTADSRTKEQSIGTMGLTDLVDMARKFELIPEVRSCGSYIEVAYDQGAIVVLDEKQSLIYLRSVIQANIQRQYTTRVMPRVMRSGRTAIHTFQCIDRDIHHR